MLGVDLGTTLAALLRDGHLASPWARSRWCIAAKASARFSRGAFSRVHRRGVAPLAARERERTAHGRGSQADPPSLPDQGRQSDHETRDLLDMFRGQGHARGGSRCREVSAVL